MMSEQEKLNLINQQYDLRYIVGWQPSKVNIDRVTVFVYDKWIGRIIYSCNTKADNRKDTYPYIQKYYGENNCVPPKQLNMEDYG